MEEKWKYSIITVVVGILVGVIVGVSTYFGVRNTDSWPGDEARRGCEMPPTSNNTLWDWKSGAPVPDGETVVFQCEVGYFFDDERKQKSFVCSEGLGWTDPDGNPEDIPPCVDDKPIDFECTAESGDGLSLVANFHETAPHQGTVVRGRLEVCPDPGSNGYLLLRVYPGVCIRDGEDPVVPPCRGRSSGSRANARERWDFEHTFRNATLRDASELEAIVVRAGASVHYALTLRQDAAAESKLWHHDVGSPADPSSDTRSGI